MEKKLGLILFISFDFQKYLLDFKVDFIIFAVATKPIVFRKCLILRYL